MAPDYGNHDRSPEQIIDHPGDSFSGGSWLLDLRARRFLAFGLRYPTRVMEPELRPLLDRVAHDERLRYRRILTEGGRVKFLLGRALTRGLLGSLLSVPPCELVFSVSSEGKPRLDDPFSGVSFNLSHCADHVLVAVSQHHEIGADVETLAHYRANVARRFFHPQEYAMLRRLGPSDQAAAFYHLWTVKEACIKALGARVPSAKLREVRASLEVAGECRSEAMKDPFHLRWEMLDLSSAVKAAVAVRLGSQQHALEPGKLFRVGLRDLFDLVSVKRPGS